jgi:NAD(P)H-nitrite reductase large subunit
MRKPKSEIAKENNRLTHLGKVCSEETKEKMRIKMSTFKHSEESKEKIRVAQYEFNAKKVINTETNEIFNSIKDASKTINKSYKSLRNQLNGTSKNKTNFIYYEE